MDMVYWMLNEKGQAEPVQLVNASGVPQPLDASDPLVARLSSGPGSGRPVRLAKEHNEFVEAMQLTEYHYYVDENNKVIPIPPGSIIQGEFEDEEEEDDNVDHDLQENDQLKNDLAQISGEIPQVAGETELHAAKTNVNLEEEEVPCSVKEEELAGGSEPAEAEVARDHPVPSYEDFGIQEHSGVTTMDEAGELSLENASETIFTQDEIELEEEVVSLQISEPELVAVKPSAKYSKKSSIFSGHPDPSSSMGRCTEAGSMGELQTKSPLKKSRKKGGTAESQDSTVDRVPSQPSRKIPHCSVEPYASPTASESSVSDTGRPKRSVPRRSVLEMLHGEGKARKPHASSGSDSEVDGTSSTQHSGKRRQSKGAEKKALTAEKLVKAPLLSKVECKNEAHVIFTSQSLPTVNADQKGDETLVLNSVGNSTVANVQSPAKRGKGRPKKIAPESPRVVEMASAVQKDFASVGSVSAGERRDDGGQQDPCPVEKESSKTDMVVTSEIDVVSKGFEMSDSILNLSATALNSNDSAETAFIDVLKPDDKEIKAEPTEVFTSDIVHKGETSASLRRKPLKRGRGRPKSTGERKMSGLESPKNAEEMDTYSAERETTVFKDIKEMDTEVAADTTPEHLLGISEAIVERSKFRGDIKSEEMVKSEDQVTRIVTEDLENKERHLDCFESGSLIHTEGKMSHREWEEESSSKSVLKEECESNGKDDTTKDVFDESSVGDHAVCKDINDRQLDEGSNAAELMTQEQEERLVLDESMESESEVAAAGLVESNVCNASVEVEDTVTHEDAWQLAKADETIVESEMCYADSEDSSHLFEGQPLNLTDTSVEMPKELAADETLEFGNEQASVGIEKNHEAIHVNTGNVLCSEEKCHAPVEEEEEDANLDHQVHDEEDIQDFNREMYFDSTGEPEEAAPISSDVELVGEERSVDSYRAKSQLTKSLLKHLKSAVELGKKKEMEPALKEFEESVLGLDVKEALLVTADLEQLATKIRHQLAYRETCGDEKEFASTSQLAVAPEERVRRLVVAELTKLRALDRELDSRHSQLMVARGQLNRSESDVKQREQRLERSRMLLDVEKDALEEDKKKLVKEKESFRKERKLCAKMKENKKRKANAELSTSSKKVRVAGPVSIKERRPLFEEITAIKETKTSTDALQAVDKSSSSENQSACFQTQVSSSADECESKASVPIDGLRLPEEVAEEKSFVKADLESEAKSDIQRSDVPLTPSGVSTVVKGKKELLRRFEADELNSPGDEQKSHKSLSHKPSEDDQKSNKSSSLKPTADQQKPNKSSSRKPTKLETPSSTISSSVVKKSGQPSSKHDQNSTLSLTPFEHFLKQSDSVKINKDTLPIASSSKGASSKSHSGKRPSHGDSERQKDLPPGPNAKKLHVDDTDVQDLTESSSKSGQKDDMKRLSTNSESSLKKRDYKQRKRVPAV